MNKIKAIDIFTNLFNHKKKGHYFGSVPVNCVKRFLPEYPKEFEKGVFYIQVELEGFNKHNKYYITLEDYFKNFDGTQWFYWCSELVKGR